MSICLYVLCLWVGYNDCCVCLFVCWCLVAFEMAGNSDTLNRGSNSPRRKVIHNDLSPVSYPNHFSNSFTAAILLGCETRQTVNHTLDHTHHG